MTRAPLERLRAAPKRAALAALGVLLAAAMAGAAITVGYGLHTGFDRSARAADLPDVIEVDVSAITELHGAVHVADLPTSSSYIILDPAEEVLGIVLPQAREVEVEEAAEAEAAAPVEAPGAATQPEAAPGETQSEPE
jgi:hypothetical protein